MIISNQTCFVDTNVMVYAADTNSPFYVACKQLIKQGRSYGFLGETNI